MVAENKQEETGRLHLNYLDGVRGLAALFVMFHHVFVFRYGVIQGVKGVAVNWLNYGHLAVDVFIVLSGFCLALPVAKTGILKYGVLNFFGRRARRILPPFYAALLLSLLLDFIVKKFGHYHPVHGDNPFAIHTIVSNSLLVQDFWQKTDTINPPFWSVALEWKIYFLFPMMIWLWRRWGLPLMILFSVVAGYGLTFLMRSLIPENSLIFPCPWYIILFASGVCVSLWSTGKFSTNWQEKARQAYFVVIISFVLTGTMLYLFPIQNQFGTWVPVTDVLCGVLVACLLTLIAHSPSSSIFNRILSAKPLVFIGTFSYSLYLIHVPVLEFIRGTLSHLPRFNHSSMSVWIGTALVGVPITLFVSYLFHLAFERPFMSKPGPKTERQAEVAAIVSPAP